MKIVRGSAHLLEDFEEGGLCKVGLTHAWNADREHNYDLRSFRGLNWCFFDNWLRLSLGFWLLGLRFFRKLLLCNYRSLLSRSLLGRLSIWSLNEWVVEWRRFLKLENDHQVFVTGEMHASWVDKVNHLGRIAYFDHFLNFFADRSCWCDILEGLMSIKTVWIEVEIVSRVTLECILTLECVKFEVTQSALLCDAI